MRILMISDVYFPRINGVSTSITTFVDEFVNQGHFVHLIAPSYDQDETDEDWITRIAAIPVPFDREDRLMSRSKIRKLLPNSEENENDLIHIHTPFVAHYLGVWLARKLKLPVIETYHTFFEEYFYHYIPLLPKRLLRLLTRRFSSSQCKQVDHVVVPSKPMAGVLRQYGITQSHSIIPTGVNITNAKTNGRVGFRQKYGITESRPVLVHIGRIAHEKNISFLLSVTAVLAKRVPNILLLIAGEGPALKDLQSKVKKLGIEDNVKFVGYLDRNSELTACYQAGDVFIFASQTETQGLVLLEAMLLGVQVVSTAEMGTKDILVNGKGVLVAKEEIHDFADKILKIIIDPKLHQILSKEGREYACSWRPDVMARRMIDLYQEQLPAKACISVPHHAS